MYNRVNKISIATAIRLTSENQDPATAALYLRGLTVIQQEGEGATEDVGSQVMELHQLSLLIGTGDDRPGRGKVTVFRSAEAAKPRSGASRREAEKLWKKTRKKNKSILKTLVGVGLNRGGGPPL